MLGNRAFSRFLESQLMVSPPRETREPEDGEDEREVYDQIPQEASAARPKECACAAGTNNNDASPETHPHEAGWFTGQMYLNAVRPPREEGWFTGNWYLTSNTIICDGGGDFTINESTNYLHGVQECSVKHEQSHMADWKARYGADICKGRAKGDLPYSVPAGKETYDKFLKKSECKAWKVGRTCRKEKLKACDSLDTAEKKTSCKDYVKKHVTFAEKQVKKYC